MNEPEEAELQWIEDGIISLGQAAFLIAHTVLYSVFVLVIAATAVTISLLGLLGKTVLTTVAAIATSVYVCWFNNRDSS